jgi:hypothetical protein
MLIIAVVIILSYLCWLGGLFLLWLWLQNSGHPPDFWVMTGALSAALGPMILLGGSVLAVRQLTEVTRSRHLSVADRLFAELNSPENITARRWIFQHLPADPKAGIPALPEEGRTAVKQVLNSLDRVAFLTQAGWIPEEMVMPWMNPMIVKAWVKLEPYLEYERQRRAEPDYYQNVRQLAQRSLAWRTRHVPDAQITWVEDAL